MSQGQANNPKKQTDVSLKSAETKSFSLLDYWLLKFLASKVLS